MNRKMIVYSLGKALRIEGLLLLIPMILSFSYQDGGRKPFLFTVLLCIIIGTLTCRKEPKDKELHIKDGFVIVAGTWILFSLFGALPFFLSGEVPRYVDALFETVSGFTTTGSTILTDIEALSRSLLFWRSFTHFIGGMGVLVFVIAVLPVERNHGEGSTINILKAEVPGPEFGKLTSRLTVTARILYGIYMAITAVLVVFLLLGGMNFFDALTTAFSTAGTGGFSSYNDSIRYFNSPFIETVLTVGMLAFGVNFNLYHAALLRGFKSFKESSELRYYLGIYFIFVLLMTVENLNLYPNFATSWHHAAFTASSVMTTTGFVTENFQLWPTLSKILLVLLMFMGACAGSTGGGLKIYRVRILLKATMAEVKRMVSPNRVVSIESEGSLVNQEKLRSILSYFAIYTFFFVFMVILIAFEGKDLTTTFTSVATTFNNVGPGLNAVGPVENFYQFTAFSKIVFIITMLAGRLEILPILILFVPDVWLRR